MNEYNIWVLVGLIFSLLFLTFESRKKEVSILDNTLNYFRVLFFVYICGNIGYNLAYNNYGTWDIIGQSAFFSLFSYFLLILLLENKKNNLDLITITISISILHSFGKIGCFSAGCCKGIVFSDIPLQLFETFCLFIISSTLIIVSKKQNRVNKYSFSYLYLTLYYSMRFFAEFYRDEFVIQLFSFRITHVLSAVVITISLYKFSLKRFLKSKQKI